MNDDVHPGCAPMVLAFLIGAFVGAVLAGFLITVFNLPSLI
jgi:hypothetical protein